MNYGDIKSHFDALLNRSDITPALTALFIDQGISRIERVLRTPLNEIVANYTFATQTASIAVPQDFLEIISVYYQDRELTRIPMSRMRQYVQHPVAGKPMYFTREQQNLLLHPQPTTGDLSIYYYGDFADMVANADENALAKAAPELIIYAGLTLAADYFLDERRDAFEARFLQILAEVQQQAHDQELQGGTQVISPSATYTDYGD